ncbi:hypothetical protein Taro_032025 [Colocasia esculenta]|uniref:Uncharacterized protein n=1 Tax=Colocasia esculenta TaxID=4460 RepID=A0A843W865_COLES|nr:hypothetical protein [Colocasia esculenta]
MRIHPVLRRLFSNAHISFLTASSAVALYRARMQPWAISFVLFSYVNLLFLFRCLRMLETATSPGDQQKKMRVKAAILLLATTLNASFCHQVTKLMPPVVSAVLWSLVVLVAAGGVVVLVRP